MIGVLDSGFGGLSVLKGLLKELPEYDYIYLGDNARAPYGEHSRETIIKFSEEGVECLFEKGAKLIIVACNTISALALRHMQNKYIIGTPAKCPFDCNLQFSAPNDSSLLAVSSPDTASSRLAVFARELQISLPKSHFAGVPIEGGLKEKKNILGVIFPACEAAAKATRNKRVGLVGTKGTIQSKAYETEIYKLDPSVKVISASCPLLVPLIEEGWHEKPETKMILKKYLRPLKNQGIDVLILGCTHYPLLMKDFRRYMGKKVTLIGGGEIAAKSLRDYLARHPVLEKGLSKGGKRVYLTTDDPKKFKELGEKFLGSRMKEATRVAL